MSIHEVINIEMLNKIIEACDEVGKMLVIKASATWCGPCKAVKPKYEKMAHEYPNVVFVEFDVEEASDIAEELDISAMPTFIVVLNKKILRRVEGADLFSIQVVLDNNNA
jgi:thioredoxin 1